MKLPLNQSRNRLLTATAAAFAGGFFLALYREFAAHARRRQERAARRERRAARESEVREEVRRMRDE